jgi:hypothetical protein
MKYVSITIRYMAMPAFTGLPKIFTSTTAVQPVVKGF